MTRCRTTPGHAVRLLVVALGLTGLLGLTGCADDAVEEISERAAERAAGGDVDIEADGDGGLDVTTDEGSFSSTVGELPDGFPDLPLLDGEIVSALAVDQGDDSGWTVSIRLDGDAEQRLEEAISLLEEAGFTTDENARVPGMAAAQVSDDELDVFITALPGDGVNVQYTITPVQG